MSDAMRQNLIGYLLQAIEPDEHAAVEQHLEKDPTLRNDCELLRACLAPLSHDREHHAPPQGLASRCCDFVYSRTDVMPIAVTAAGDARAVNRRRWSWLDLTVAGAIAVAVAVLFVPAIYQSQAMAQRTACQKNLQDIGTAMTSYANFHDGYYPVAQPDDPVHVGSAWASKVVGTLPRGDRTLICPSAPRLDDPNFHVPSMAELSSLNAAQLAQVSGHLSGNYGGTLGYKDHGKYTAPRQSQSADLALAADAAGPNATNSPNHGGDGQYVLFGNQAVKYVTSPEMAGTHDNIYINGDGEEGPGTGPGDAVLTHKAIELKP